MLNKKGFTLIEILIVVLIIGILAAIALPYYNSAVGKARASEGFTNLKALVGAQEIFFLNTGRYTIDLNDLDWTVEDNDNIEYHCEDWGFCQSFIKGYVYIEYNYPKQLARDRQWAVNLKFCIAVDGKEANKKICQSLNGSQIAEQYGTNNTYFVLP